MTTPVALALAVGGLIVGVVFGFLIARGRTRREERRPTGPTVAELLERLVRSSNNGVVVLNRFGDMVLHNPRAYELGLVKVNQADPRARKAAEQVVETDEPMEIDLSPLEARGRQPEAVLGEVRPLGDGFTVVEAVDHSEAIRLEAVRRDFVANVSHELKTPVGAIALLTEAVLDAAEDTEEVRRFGGKILRESTRLGQLVTELIALSRLQGAERLPDLNVVEVDAVVREALGRTTLSAESAEITITTDAASGLLIEGDRTLMVTALSNLLENAVAYSQPGSPVSISRRLVDGKVEIAVTDRGIGIAEDEQQRVFERFYRADKARSRATGGTGLGLAIVKHVAANHGGSVGLWSRPGTGSTFTLRIPAHIPAEPAAPHETGSAGVPAGEDPRADTPSRGNRARKPRPWRKPVTRVLIVEDEESFADPLAFLLRKEGFTAAVAVTGQQALEEFDRNGADIVLLDLMLPGMSGTDVCKQLRQRSAVPVIMVTARDSEIDKVVGLELGADDYVTKPYSARELIARVRAVLRRGGEPGSEGDLAPLVLAAGPVRMDVERHVVTVDGQEVSLPLKEFDLLEYLLRNVGRVLTRGQLIDRVWGADYVGDTKTLDVHVKRLRSKIEPDPGSPRHLVTVRGLGYKFET